MRLSNQQWKLLSPILKLEKKETRGRPRVNDRRILNGILWILRTGAPWKDMPTKYPPYQTCHRRFQEWSRNRYFDEILASLAQDMETRGGISLEECFIDGTFASAKKGGLKLVLRNVGREPRSWQLQIKTLFQSPLVWRALLLTKSPWWKKRLTENLRKEIQKNLLETRHMIVTPVMKY